MDGYARFQALSAAQDAADERADIAARLEAAAARIDDAMDKLRYALEGAILRHDDPDAGEDDALHAETMAARAAALLAQVTA
jgi:hypothetical protein